MNTPIVIRFSITAVLFVIAVFLGVTLWNNYLHTPWTRDGRIRADVINVAPEVSGKVVLMNVKDNQFVRKGDVLFIIDSSSYTLTLQQADALLASRRADYARRQKEAARRDQLREIIAEEARETSRTEATSASAVYRQAQAARDQAQLDLQRTEVRSPVDGYISNLNIHAGDYAHTGQAVVAIIDSHSFWVNGYFEETKIPLIRVGDPVSIRLMSGNRELNGHVEGISRGITDRDNVTGQELLADVNPTFTWVRLAQRIPVRIHIDSIPDDVVLSAGMTCTLVVKPRKTSENTQGNAEKENPKTASHTPVPAASAR